MLHPELPELPERGQALNLGLAGRARWMERFVDCSGKLSCVNDCKT